MRPRALALVVAGEVSLAGPAVERAYGGIDAVAAPEADDGVVQEREPTRPNGAALWLDPRSTAREGEGLHRPAIDPLATEILAEEARTRRVTGRGPLVVGGTAAALAALSGVAVAVLSSSQAGCSADASRLALAPCREQVESHRAATGLATGLWLAALPWLAVGALLHGRDATRAGRPGPSALERTRHTALGYSLLGTGLTAVGAAFVVDRPVLAGTCDHECLAPSAGAQVLWWTGTLLATAGVVVAAHVRGRARPRPPRAR